MNMKEPYFCMQAKNPNKIHCSDSLDPDSRQQCDTCHAFELERAADEAGKKPLARIAEICRLLTYGEMLELQTQLEKHMLTAKTMADTIHLWSKNYGMDNVSTSSSNTNPFPNTSRDDVEIT